MLHRGVPINGRAFAELRRGLRLTQDEMAGKLGMTGGNVARIERAAVTGINVRNFRRLAELVGIEAKKLERQIGAGTAPAAKAARSANRSSGKPAGSSRVA